MTHVNSVSFPTLNNLWSTAETFDTLLVCDGTGDLWMQNQPLQTGYITTPHTTGFGQYNHKGVNNWDGLLPKLEKEVNLPSNPPSNCYFSEDLNELVLEFAMAGRRKDDVTVQTIGNSIEIKSQGTKNPEDRRYVKTGISGKEVAFTVNIDDAYSALEAVATLEEGILTIKLPRVENQKTRKLL